MAPNNALGKPTAARMRASVEGNGAVTPRRSSARLQQQSATASRTSSSSSSSSSSTSRRRSRSRSRTDLRLSTADGFGAGGDGNDLDDDDDDDDDDDENNTGSSSGGGGRGAVRKSSMVDAEEVRSRGTGTALERTPLEDFEAAYRFPQDELRCVWTAIMFLTRLPCPGWCDHHPGFLMKSMAYFPLIGALIGVWAAAIYDGLTTTFKLPPLVAAAMSSGCSLWLTGCFHEDGLCDTLDGFGGGWTKNQILTIMKDSRSGSYATMGASFWAIAKCAAIAHLAASSSSSSSIVYSTWTLGASAGAGPAMVVAQAAARATAAPLLYFFEYVVDDADAKGEYYNWFGDSQRLLGLWRVLAAAAAAAAVAFALLPSDAAARAMAVVAVATPIAGLYGQSIIGGVMGDFLGATICVVEVAIYVAIGADLPPFDASSLPLPPATAPASFGAAAEAMGQAMGDWGPLVWLAAVLSLPQVYGLWRRRHERQLRRRDD